MFVYKHFTNHLLDLAQKDLPLALTRRILKDILRGPTALHHHSIVHTGNLCFLFQRPFGRWLMRRRCQAEQYLGRVEG
jgi:hypothetical protein